MAGTVLLTAALAVAPPALAVDNDLQQWSIVTFRAELPHRLRLYAEAQPRVDLLNTPGIDRLLLRPALGYQLTRHVSLWQGYAWTPTFQPNLRQEHRLYQQLQIETPGNRWAMNNRTRLEQRFIEGAGETSVRVRHMLRLSYALGKRKKWSLVGYDEFFVHLNSTPSGPQAGFDQNRIYLGAAYHFNSHVQAETGYLFNYVNRANGVSDRIQHIILFGLNFRT
jgi:hypothetical protein